MYLPRSRHRWDLSPQEAVRLQKKLAGEIKQTPLSSKPQIVAGGDVSFSGDGRQLVAAWVVWDLAEEVVVETTYAAREVTFPYVLGLLSFREAPALLAAAKKLKTEPDAFMFDGQGLAHPRRFGIASHVGLLMDRPTCGCAKSRLCGRHAEPSPRVGSSTQLTDDNGVIGRVVRTRDRVKPIYVSVGHRMTLSDAMKLTLRCRGKYRVPEPTRLAHHLVTKRRKELFG